MKLRPETIAALDELAGTEGHRSALIELAVVEFLDRKRRELREQRDLEILNERAEDLNREAEDCLAFQA